MNRPHSVEAGAAELLSDGRRTTHLARASDDFLMTLIGDGDEAALGALIQRFWGPLISYAVGFRGGLDEAEDLVQETFARCWLCRRSWIPGGSVRGYLYTITRNLCLNSLAASRTRARAEGQEPVLIRRASTPEEVLQEREVACVLGAEIESLPERRQEIFKLVCIHGLSYREVGAAMGIAVPTVATR